MNYTKRYLFSALILLSSFVFAAKDPVGWSLIPASGLPAQTEIGDHYAITYTITNNLPFTVPITIESTNWGSAFSLNDQCNGKVLRPKGQTGSICLMSVSFNPVIAEVVNAQLVLHYHKNVVPLPGLSTTVVGKTGPVIGNSDEDLPTISCVNQGPYQFQFSFTNTGNSTANGSGSFLSPNAAVTVISNNCSNSGSNIALAAGGSCQMRGSISPVSAGAVSVQGVFNYTFGSVSRVALVTTQTTVSADPAACTGNVTADVTLPFPAQTFPYSDNIVQFSFKNQSTAPMTLGSVTFTASPASLTQQPGTDNCSNMLLNPGQACTVTRSVIPSTTGPMSVTASVTANGTQHSATTSSTVVANDYTTHKVTFVNQCPFDVYYGIANDGPGKLDPTPAPANPDAYKLTRQQVGVAPSTKSLNFNDTYIGLFFPRTDCSSINGQLVCGTGNCETNPAPNGGKCLLGNEPQQPYTKLEMNMFSTAQSDGSFDGVYDVSVINGFNIPVEIKGLGPTIAGTGNNLFACTGAGAPIQSNALLGSCAWSLTPPVIASEGISAIDFNFVTNGGYGGSCNTVPCNAGDTCGLAYVNPQTGDYNITRACGTLLGYWTVNELCGKPPGVYIGFGPGNPSPLTLFSCETTLNSIPVTQTYAAGTSVYDLYACKNPSLAQLDSCYNSGTGTKCCGCYNWNQPGSIVPTAQTVQCNDPGINTSTNADWTTARPSGALALSPFESILWLKQGCPTSYVYPFDDKSSSFYCKQSPAGTNVKMNYQYVFCPGGISTL